MSYIPSDNLTIEPGAHIPSNDLVISGGEPPPVVTYVTLRSNYKCSCRTQKKKNNEYQLAWTAVQGLSTHTAIRFSKADQRNACVIIHYSVNFKLNQDYKILFGAFFEKNINVSINWQELLPDDKNMIVLFGTAIAKNVSIKSGWNRVQSLDIDKQISYGQASPISVTYTFSLDGLNSKNIDQSIPWGVGIKPLNRYEYHPPIVIVPVPPPPVDPPVTLGSFNAYREDTGESVELLSCAINLDKDSWSWSLSASVADKTSLDRINPGLAGVVELHIEVSGYHWIFVIQSYTEAKQFDDSKGLVLQYKIQGLSKTAYLGHPFAPRRDYEQTTLFTANQLINNELQLTGFTAAYGITDWLIDAGAYSYSQKSPIESIAQIAAAPGALVVPDRLNDVIEIKYDYPESHWNWSAMGNLSQITDDQILTISGKYRPGIEYNGVYVTGQNVGITAWIRRTGTAGDILHQTIIDSLITDAVPARERGRNVISGSGNKMEYDIEMLFLDGSELYQISQIVTVIEQGNQFQAKVEGIEIEVTIKNDMPIAFQLLNLIRHIQ